MSLIKANEVYCNVCAKFIRPVQPRFRETPFVVEPEGPHFCSHQCAKSFYDSVEAAKKFERGIK